MPKAKAPKLDAATLDVVKRVLALPPKQNKDLRVGRPEPEKRKPKGRASSSKPRTA
jgi:hypothetical protein